MFVSKREGGCNDNGLICLTEDLLTHVGEVGHLDLLGKLTLLLKFCEWCADIWSGRCWDSGKRDPSPIWKSLRCPWLLGCGIGRFQKSSEVSNRQKTLIVTSKSFYACNSRYASLFWRACPLISRFSDEFDFVWYKILSDERTMIIKDTTSVLAPHGNTSFLLF